jgi:hypothetical protein
MTTERTIEQRLKFDCGLPIGVSCVELVKAGKSRRVLVEIGKRGIVHAMVQPRDEDMYTSWRRVTGNALSSVRGKVIVWAARSDEFRNQYAQAFENVAAKLEV